MNKYDIFFIISSLLFIFTLLLDINKFQNENIQLENEIEILNIIINNQEDTIQQLIIENDNQYFFINDLKYNVSILTKELKSKENIMDSLIINFTKNYEILEDKLISSEAYYIPTYNELKSILRRYEDKHLYDLKNYNCVDFSNSLIQYLNDKNINSCITILDLSNISGHAIVGIETNTDIIYIDPQNMKYFNNINNIHEYYYNYYDINISKISSCYEQQIW
jgi:hypothetical protein